MNGVTVKSYYSCDYCGNEFSRWIDADNCFQEHASWARDSEAHKTFLMETQRPEETMLLKDCPTLKTELRCIIVSYMPTLIADYVNNNNIIRRQDADILIEKILNVVIRYTEGQLNKGG